MLEQHQARASLRLAGLLSMYQHELASELAEVCREPELARSVLIAALTTPDWRAHGIAQDLMRRGVEYSEEDVRLLVALSERRDGDAWTDLLIARTAASGLEELVRTGSDAGDLVVRLVKVVESTHRSQGADWTKLAVRVRKLEPGREDEKVIRSVTAWLGK